MILLESDNTQLVNELAKIHSLLNQDSSSQSAKAVIDFINE